MHTNPIAPNTIRSGIYVADRYGIRIHVNRRHLVIADGCGSQRRERHFHRAAHGLKRLVILGQPRVA